MARLRLTLFTILAITLLAAASYPFFHGQILPRAHAASVNFSLIASVNGWNYTQPSGKNPTITVHATDNVFISFTTADTQQHRFYVDVARNGLPPCSGRDLCSPVFNSTNPITYGWVSGVLNPGIYNYYDTNSLFTTNGTLIVRTYTSSPDYTIAANPSAITIIQGSSQTSTITVTSENNFTGTVNLTANPVGVAATLNPTSVSPPKNGTVTSMLNVTVPASTTPGNYLVSISSTNGTIQHNTIVYVQVVAPDFSITSNANTLDTTQGSSVTVTITITSQNSFSGKVSLKHQIAPNGPTPSLNPITVNIPSGGSQSSTLTVSTTPTTAPGNYTITITGNATSTSGQLAHSLAITLRVSPPPTSPGSSVLSTFLFGAIATAILVLSLVILLARRRSTRQ